jgi:hypothetical protein
MNCGNGTKPNKKHREKRTDLETRDPKQETKAPIHDSTIANISIESCTSEDREDDPSAKPATKMAAASKTQPTGTFEVTFDRREGHSRTIRAALIGRIKSMCVYSSFRSASAKVSIKGRHPTSTETASRRSELS